LDGESAKEHVTEMVTVAAGRDRTAFVVRCSCGWSSRQLSTAGMAAAASARHIEEPTWDGGR
jgi:hypothetical protein